MGRESMNDPIVTQSSIALLQERFRQLERMKEMREERELLRKLAEPKQCNNPTCYEPSGLLFFHLLTTPRPRSPPSPPPRQVPNMSSLWSGLRSGANWPPPPSSTFGYMETPLFGLLPTTTVTGKSSPTLHVSLNKSQDSDYNDDIDTSLHL
ncbi:hypothetical protein ERO13_D06G161500v2 [Gossypium hirsutum]|uniref:Uncharacterized protein n=7 Tax=Gossypium TaxID=3633 RepID=A0A5J5R7T6_GOSBA|nr:hypothetical protein ES319_D06G190500v1 [Gossypium barbadense]KAG4142996.1 hypothetical protein ERO13_D06G161500v2 [Gossypium hirsutum]MBA0627135.1 hypothetical protein [Gossypium davidsonii]MBA0662774.1 hypothetical protein [Gossypium klotzschianum]TYG65639.1 hypothetical protein ES288_D06G202300v1 [Gossypium darwinii]TYH67698.1 hypothetical protein ES332_D06G205700v1 [Gossypium tomentosum]TYI78149.1 hypothetical protein E1A91_D06G190900v1 [Gossypium mustelinum]